MSPFKCAFSSVMLASLACLSGAAQAATSSFGVVLLPDTQFYSRYATAAEGSQFMKRYGTEPYMSQTQWLAQHAKTLGIPFVIHLGDVVDQQDKNDQWKVADAAMSVLETAGVPYSILAGNHDVTVGCGYSGSQADCTDEQRNLSAEPYVKWFSSTRAQKNATFGGRDPSGFHEYHVFEGQGQKFLVLSLSWRPSDTALAWARGVIAAHPTMPVIVSSHDGLAIASDATTALQTSYSDLLWERLVRDNDQIFLMVNGHNHGSARTTRTNSFGHVVEELVVDYQMAYQGGNAYMRVLEFDLKENKIKSLSFSPWVPEKPKETLNQFDSAVLADARNEFTVDMNFAQRFARFNPSFSAGEPNREEPLIETVRQLILENYSDVPAITPVLPYDKDDYPRVSGALAHWRFVGAQPGSPVADGGVVADETGLNPLFRIPLERGAQLADALWSKDHHALSSAQGSVCFTENSNNGQRQSFFQTQSGAPLNEATLRDGYTVEAFVKMSKDWTAGSNQWMTILSRFGVRGDLQGFLGGWKGSSTLQYAISNLRELQWEPTVRVGGAAYVQCASEGQTCSFPGTAQVRYGANGQYKTVTAKNSVACTNDAFGGDPIPGVGKTCQYLVNDQYNSKTNWSGEIMTDTWQHVAIVNDPVSHDTTMYVEGAPVLRNTQNAVGVATLPDAVWLIGGAASQGSTNNGFKGCINEVRITGRALESAEWLTARKTRVNGSGGRQEIVGTDGDDLITGNQGSDTLTGGKGADTFVFRSMRDGVDTITDFTPGEDKINLHSVLLSVGYGGTSPLSDGFVRVTDTAGGSLVQIDTDGTVGKALPRSLIIVKGLTAQQLAKAENFVF